MSTNHPKHERTLVIIKPDGIQRSLIGEIIKRYERVGLALCAAKMMVPTRDLIEKHYTLDEEWRQKVGEKSIAAYNAKGVKHPYANPLEAAASILERLCEYMTSGPVMVMVWQGAHAVAIVRKLTGGTEPLSSDVGTIRGDFVLDSYGMSDVDNRPIRNLVHASGTVEEAQDEIAHWFAPDEVLDYKVIATEEVMYAQKMKGILRI